MKPLGIYIHIPFCKSKCIYCDFNSKSGMEAMYSDYIDALIKEIKGFSKKAQHYIVNTVFFGGGTPSVIPPEYIARVLSTIRIYFNLDTNAEITIETNPGTIDSKKLDIYINSGINRLSMGVQSFSDNSLRFIGRVHDAADVYKSYECAKKAGFENINVDLIFCLPGQTLYEWEYTLNETLKLSPSHISAYGLIIEEGTRLHQMYINKEFKINDEELDRQMYETTKQKLQTNGYAHYEISNFAKSGYECLHNINYWDCGEYAGFGVAAHSYFQSYRYANTADISDYINMAKNNQQMYENAEFIDYNSQISEFMFLGLRKIIGVSENEFLHRFGKPIDSVYESQIIKFISLGLITRSGGYLMLTERGIDVSNIVFSEFLL